MNAFWTSINKLAQGQLFAHGHLSARTALELANKSDAPQPQRCGGGTPQRRATVMWPRLAIPH